MGHATPAATCVEPLLEHGLKFDDCHVVGLAAGATTLPHALRKGVHGSVSGTEQSQTAEDNG